MKTRTNKLRKIISMLLISFIAVTSLNAQQHNQRNRPQGPPPMPDSTQILEMMDKLAVELSLSDSQKEKVSELHFTHFKEAQKMRKKQRAAREKNKQMMDTNREKFETQIMALLSEDQQQAFKEFKEHKRENRKGEHKQAGRKGEPKSRRGRNR